MSISKYRTSYTLFTCEPKASAYKTKKHRGYKFSEEFCKINAKEIDNVMVIYQQFSEF